MKNKIFYLFVIISIIFVLNILYLSNLLSPFKKYLPNEFNKFLTNTILYFPSLIKERNAFIKKYEITLNDKLILENKISEIQYFNDNVNEEIFPQTQFVRFDYNSIKLSSIEKKKSSYLNNIYTSPFYIELFNNYLITTSKRGTFYYHNVDELLVKNLKVKKIETSLKNNIEIMDTLVHKDKIFITFHDKEKNCENFSIFQAELNLKFLDFKDFFTIDNGSGECKEQDGVGGRIAFYIHNNKPGLLATIFNAHNIKNMKDQFNISKEFKFSSLIFIDFDKKKSEVFATGFRNPQGLLVLGNNQILTSEHGPRGGDEINNIKFGNNYGYPDASYGERYLENYSENDTYKFKKKHNKYGYTEPVFSFVPSVAPSQMIELNNNFSERWKDNVILSTLKSQSLYRITFDESYSRIITYEKIRIGKRIRDVVYDEKNKIIFLAEENDDGSIGVLKIKK